MSVCAVLTVKYSRKHSLYPKDKSQSPAVEIISSLRLSARDIFLVVHCGPDVFAFTVGNAGTCLMGRWSYDEWLKASPDN